MKTSDFDFDLPAELIANVPADPRDSARLLYINGFDVTDFGMLDLPRLLKPTDVLVFNDTKVIPARLYGTSGEAKIEMTLFKQVNLSTWESLIKNARRLHTGDKIDITSDFYATVLDKKENGAVVVQFNYAGADLFTKLHEVGTMPLPPYIKRERGGKESDKADYQTIYARHEGAVAAPTAGLHFTERVFKALDDKGIKREFITLHVGGGTFLPVKEENVEDHKMHAEYGVITPEVADRLNHYKNEGRRIVPVGTTSLRLLESAADEKGILHPFAKETAIFITPGYKFKFSDALFTNFHTPQSTLFMLVSAFAGIDEMRSAYKHAVEKKYRFFSYGDACLIEKKN
ncbi:MAG: tRNA preQ1(34) S-adenosylmethionine ribosyltransferase-isomerase QueA [Alphaproteobacteria bacterium]|nr:tRNA preQ1(34) S-adenosylmethionine ribosyltransferase-isomerase QueA [Alphaproteobacteria bacterium]